jgi:hypothetical protein
VLVTDDTVKGKRTETMRYGAVTDEMINNPSIRCIDPDVLYSDDLDAAKYDSLDENALVKVTDARGKTQVFLSGTTTIIFLGGY